jgi:hypothetical protein
MYYKSKKTRIFDATVFELIGILVIYIGAMIFAMCIFDSPNNEPLEIITVTGYTEEETTTTTTTTTETTTTTTTTTTEETTTTTTTTTTTVPTTLTKKVTTTTKTEVNPTGVSKNNLKLLGTFTGTYYKGDTYTCKGGSGRTLIDCKSGGQGVKGSVASKYVYNKYKYCHNGRTKVYIEVPSIPSMTGWYYVDDCCGSSSVIDFYYHTYDRAPFKSNGVISVKVHI